MSSLKRRGNITPYALLTKSITTCANAGYGVADGECCANTVASNINLDNGNKGDVENGGVNLQIGTTVSSAITKKSFTFTAMLTS